ncbi:MAG: transglycosylase SLT domain-containing protein [Rhodospirillaceae bacterium]|nr:transglycosylase SLT domain-containing protein [Rhodospirillaceae bacterium]
MRWKRALLPCLATLAFVSWPSPSWPLGFTDKYDRPIQQAVKRWWPDLPVWKLWKAQLYQESRLDPAAVSPAGARGLAQFMPATWREIARQLDLGGSPHDEIAIDAGAYYMAKLRRTWRRDRSSLERNQLAQASYNAGAGNILKAQSYCGGARLWPAVRECLPLVTGAGHTRETITYVERIERWWREMELTP